MTLEQNITAILESYFSGFKDELIEACAQRIMRQIERQSDTPQTDEIGDCNSCEYLGDLRCGMCTNGSGYRRRADTPQTDCGWK